MWPPSGTAVSKGVTMNLTLERRLQFGLAISLLGILIVAGLSLSTLDRVMETDALKRTRTQVEAASSIGFPKALQKLRPKMC